MISSAITLTKRALRPARNRIRKVYDDHLVRHWIEQKEWQSPGTFRFDDFKQRILEFMKSMRAGSEFYLYRYATSCTRPTLYASAYAAMTLSLLGEVDSLCSSEKDAWRNYFDSMQDEESGLFYDPAVANDLYDDTDWWGARHLAPHMISAYTALGMRPRHPFIFLRAFCEPGRIAEWLGDLDWASPDIGLGDIDNKIMNVGCLLQYQRDTWGDSRAHLALEELKSFLKSAINPRTGMWGGFREDIPEERSRMVQFAYHLYPLYFYDGDYAFDVDNIVRIVLDTQNEFGGYGVKSNSSACEDIDSIDILTRLHGHCSEALRSRISDSLRRAFEWVLMNHMEDGGFTFRLNEPFVYGSSQMSSGRNVGAMFPTWFRTLAIAYSARHLGIGREFKLSSCPGYVYQ